MDAGAALRPAAIDVELGRWIYTIPALSAADWIEALLDEEGGAIVPGLLDPETRQDVWREFLKGNISKQELEDGWRAALAAVSGQPWWQAARLTMSVTAPEAWPIIHGKLTMRGVDLTQVSFGAFYNAVYYIGLQSCKDEEDRAQWEFSLTLPPPEVAPEEALASLPVEEDFMAAMSAFQSLGPASTAT
jgi:hypothetical protein